MQRERIEIALRVLTTLSYHRDPAAGDVNQLRAFAESNEERTMPLDELACAVIARERRRIEQKLFGTQYIKARSATG